jgi:L,D-transpeptidase ErfK/SrfK
MKRIVVTCLVLLVPSAAFAVVITGGDTVYPVMEGDSLLLISAKFGVDLRAIIRDNGLDPAAALRPGQVLWLNTRKIAPRTPGDGIVIDIPGRMLYSFRSGRLEMRFPVGLGMPAWRGNTRWRTPAKAFVITAKERDPVWYVPASIQWKMLFEGKPVLPQVPPGPDNPLGRYALYTSVRGIAIHETIWPTTVYRFRSHGCVRVLTEHIERFYEEVGPGTPGELVYEPVKIAVTEEGRIFLQVDPDVYGKAGRLLDAAIERINGAYVGAEADWTKVRKVVQDRTGIAEDVTLFPVPVPGR